MPLFNDIYKATVTNGGGTINLPVTDSTVTRYIFSGTATLAAGYVIQASGTPLEGMEFDIRWQAVVTTAGANVVTVFGTTLTTAQALSDLQIRCYYNGSAWDVDIQEDAVQNIWKNGSGGVDSVVRVNGGTSTATVATAMNAGYNCTSSGVGSFVAGINSDVTADYGISIGNSCVASANASVATGNDTTASGAQSTAQGSVTIASGIASHAINQENTASGDYSLATGYKSLANRYGQMSRGSGVPTGANKIMQRSELTAWSRTTDATATLAMLDGEGGSQAITIPNNSCIYFRGEAVGVQQAGSAGTAGDSATWHFNGCIKNIAGTTALVDTVRWQDNTGAWGGSAQRTQDAAAAAWTVVPTANNGTDTLDITVTGEANKTVYWLINLELTEVRFAT